LSIGPQECGDYKRGQCRRANCKFAHGGKPASESLLAGLPAPNGAASLPTPRAAGSFIAPEGLDTALFDPNTGARPLPRGPPHIKFVPSRLGPRQASCSLSPSSHLLGFDARLLFVGWWTNNKRCSPVGGHVSVVKRVGSMGLRFPRGGEFLAGVGSEPRPAADCRVWALRHPGLGHPLRVQPATRQDRQCAASVHGLFQAGLLQPQGAAHAGTTYLGNRFRLHKLTVTGDLHNLGLMSGTGRLDEVPPAAATRRCIVITAGAGVRIPYFKRISCTFVCGDGL